MKHKDKLWLNDIEKVMVCKEVEKLEIEEAKNRMEEGKNQYSPREKFPQGDKGQ